MYDPLSALGLVSLSFVAYSLARALLPFIYLLLKPLLNTSVDIPSSGRWAVVTGGTDGLGRAYVNELAKMGMDVVIISRTKSKLEAVAEDVEKRYKVKTKIIEADFTSGEIYPKVKEDLEGLEIGVLVNNVGISYPHPEYFLELENKEKIYSDMVQCNVMSVLSMCQIVMPAMVKRKKGIVINISSGLGAIPAPQLAVYGATKSFVMKFSKDLSAEYKKHGITIQCLIPGVVATNMSKVKKFSLMSPSPSVFVSKALQTVGICSETAGYLPHSILIAGVSFVESIFPSFTEGFLNKSMEKVKAKAMRTQKNQ